MVNQNLIRNKRIKKENLSAKIFWVIVILTLITGSIYLFKNTRFADEEYLYTRRTVLYDLDWENSISQSVRDESGNLTSLRFYLNPLEKNGFRKYSIDVVLRNKNSDLMDPLTYHFNALPATINHFIDINLPESWRDGPAEYSILFSTDAPPGKLAFLGSELDSFPDGDLLLNGYETTGDLTFAGYKNLSAAELIRNLLRSFIPLIKLLVFTSLLTFIGCLVLVFGKHAFSDKLLDEFVFSVFCGTGYLILLSILFSWLRIPLDLKTYGISILMLVFLVLFVHRKAILFLFRKPNKFSDLKDRLGRLKTFQDISLFWGSLLLFSLALWIRLALVAGTEVPYGVDAVFHQKLLEDMAFLKGLTAGQNYHAGFHCLAYFMAEVLNLPLNRVNLIAGVWISALMGFSYSLFAREYLKNPLALFVFLLFFWFLLPFPVYLLNWSRFPFLLGLAFLPLPILFTRQVLIDKKGEAFLAAFLLLAAIFSHYGSLLFWFGYILVRMGPTLLKKGGIFVFLTDKKHKKNVRNLMISTAAVMLILAAKAIYLFLGGDWFSLVSGSDATGSPEMLRVLFISFEGGGSLVWLLSLGSLFFLNNKDLKNLAVLVFWLVVMFLFNLLQILILKVSTTAGVNILIFFSLLIPLVFCLALERHISGFGSLLFDRKKGLKIFLAGVPVLLIITMGSISIRGMINPLSILFSKSDFEAANWMAANIGSDHTVMVYAADINNSQRSSGAGGWLDFLDDYRIVYTEGFVSFDSMQEFVKKMDVEYIYEDRFSNWGEILLEEKMLLAYPQVFKNQFVRIYQVSE